MTTITDEHMKQMLQLAKNYTLVILKSTDKRNEPGVESIIWEHGRRNFALRAEELLSIVCPVTDGSDISGVGIFNADIEEVKKLMDEDPGVQASVFVYEVHSCRSFPGSTFPE